jgi:ABC-type transport system substrate-binding protein
MTKRAIYIDPDTGVLAVVNPAYNDGSRPSGESDDDFFTRVVDSAVPDGVTYRVIDDADAATLAFLKERTFRGAWEHDADGVPVVNMAKARGIHMDVIRLSRNAELAAKDITFMRAVEAGDTDTQATIATEKQTLRDIPQTFDLTTDTPEELKAQWPTELPARE